MEMVDLSRLIYDGMPKIPVLPDVHVQKFFSLDKGHPLNVTELALSQPEILDKVRLAAKARIRARVAGSTLMPVRPCTL